MRPHALYKTHSIIIGIMENGIQWLIAFNLDFAVCPSWDLDNEVDDGLVRRIGIKRNVVPERCGLATFFQPDAPVLYICVRKIVSWRTSMNADQCFVRQLLEGCSWLQLLVSSAKLSPTLQWLMLAG
jgi:hypothetical protein